MTTPTQPAGWYHAEGDPANTQRYWDGSQWIGGPTPVAPGYATVLPGLNRASATAGSRMLGQVIDHVLWAAVTFPFTASSVFGGDTFSQRAFAASAVTAVLYFAYTVAMVRFWGATVGKLIMKVEVIAQDGESPPSWATSVRRASVHLLGVIPVVGSIASFVVGLVSLIFLINDDRHRTVMDRFAETYVVMKGSGGRFA